MYIKCRTDDGMMARVTSCEIVWVTVCNAQIGAQFELGAHPDHRME